MSPHPLAWPVVRRPPRASRPRSLATSRPSPRHAASSPRCTPICGSKPRLADLRLFCSSHTFGPFCRRRPALLLGAAAVLICVPLQAAREISAWILTGEPHASPWGRALRWRPRGAPPPRRARARRAVLWAARAALLAWLLERRPWQPHAPPPPPLRDAWVAQAGQLTGEGVRVAIIGAGVGGAFASDVLRAFAPRAHIDVYGIRRSGALEPRTSRVGAWSAAHALMSRAGCRGQRQSGRPRVRHDSVG